MLLKSKKLAQMCGGVCTPGSEVKDIYTVFDFQARIKRFAQLSKVLEKKFTLIKLFVEKYHSAFRDKQLVSLLNGNPYKIIKDRLDNKKKSYVKWTKTTSTRFIRL